MLMIFDQSVRMKGGTGRSGMKEKQIERPKLVERVGA